MIGKTLFVAIAFGSFTFSSFAFAEDDADQMDILQYLSDGVMLEEVELEYDEEGYEDGYEESFNEEGFVATRYAVACISNRLSSSKKYSIKWGDGSWRSFTLSPGYQRAHKWKYSTINEGRSPYLNIRFDSDMTKNTFFTTYRLTKYASVDGSCSSGKKYFFTYESNRSFVDLKAQ